MYPAWNYWMGEPLLPGTWLWWTESGMDCNSFTYWLGRFEPIEDEV